VLVAGDFTDIASGDAANEAFLRLERRGDMRIDESSVTVFRRVLDPAEREALLADSQYTTGWIREAIRKNCRDPRAG